MAPPYRHKGLQLYHNLFNMHCARGSGIVTYEHEMNTYRSVECYIRHWSVSRFSQFRRHVRVACVGTQKTIRAESVGKKGGSASWKGSSASTRVLGRQAGHTWQCNRINRCPVCRLHGATVTGQPPLFVLLATCLRTLILHASEPSKLKELHLRMSQFDLQKAVGHQEADQPVRDHSTRSPGAPATALQE